jgi:hypothetical protein
MTKKDLEDLVNTFRFHKFKIFNDIKNIVYFDFPNHCIFKMFQ